MKKGGKVIRTARINKILIFLVHFVDFLNAFLVFMENLIFKFVTQGQRIPDWYLTSSEFIQVRLVGI